MKKILIISPHYPPSNLAAVHRSRLFAQHLPALGWLPVVLTVHEKHYEESLDWTLCQLLPSAQRIEKVAAWPLTKPRLIGDLGLRAFWQLRQKAIEIIRQEKIDFVYISIPSFYAALLGPVLHKKTGVRYGIDYIDPWVHVFPGSNKLLSRHWWSTKLAKWLEPKAVKHASLITGVAEGYFSGVVQRNPHLARTCLFGAMPYGFEVRDFRMLSALRSKSTLFRQNGSLQLVYAGALLPKAVRLLEAVFKAIAFHRKQFDKVEFHFIGTGKSPTNVDGFAVRPLAEKYALWNSVVFEYPQRLPYLEVLQHLQAADAGFVLGSTESHYTPSKIFQAIASKRPVLAILHQKSTAAALLQSAGAGRIFSICSETGEQKVEAGFCDFFQEFCRFQKSYKPEQTVSEIMQQFSAAEMTRQLATLLNRATESIHAQTAV